MKTNRRNFMGMLAMIGFTRKSCHPPKPPITASEIVKEIAFRDSYPSTELVQIPSDPQSPWKEYILGLKEPPPMTISFTRPVTAKDVADWKLLQDKEDW